MAASCFAQSSPLQAPRLERRGHPGQGVRIRRSQPAIPHRRRVVRRRVAAILYFPPLSASSSGGLSELIPPGSAAARAEGDAVRLFGFPLDAAWPSCSATRRHARDHPGRASTRHRRGPAARCSVGPAGGPGLVSRGSGAGRPGNRPASPPGPVSPGPPGGIPGLAGAFPLPTPAPPARDKERDTTVITFLFFRPGTSFGEQTAAADAYVHWFLDRPADNVVGVTGPIRPNTLRPDHRERPGLGRAIHPARHRADRRPAVQVDRRATGRPAARHGVRALRPDRGVVCAALVFRCPPISNPCSSCCCSGDHRLLGLLFRWDACPSGRRRTAVRAARLATAEYAPIVFAAGVIVAAATASLAVARAIAECVQPRPGADRAHGDGRLDDARPALMATSAAGSSGRSRPGCDARRQRREGAGEGVTSGSTSSAVDLRTRTARLAAARPVALLIAAAGTAALLVAAWSAHDLHLGSPLIKELRPHRQSLAQARPRRTASRPASCPRPRSW